MEREYDEVVRCLKRMKKEKINFESGGVWLLEKYGRILG